MLGSVSFSDSVHDIVNVALDQARVSEGEVYLVFRVGPGGFGF